MYIIQSRAQVLILKFLLVPTVSWLPSRYKVRLATLDQVSPGSVLCLRFHVCTGSEVPQKAGVCLKGRSSQKPCCPWRRWQLGLPRHWEPLGTSGNALILQGSSIIDKSLMPCSLLNWSIPKTVFKNLIWCHSQIFLTSLYGTFIYYSHLSVKILVCNKFFTLGSFVCKWHWHITFSSLFSLIYTY